MLSKYSAKVFCSVLYVYLLDINNITLVLSENVHCIDSYWVHLPWSVSTAN